MPVKLKFLGGTRTVTGSMHLLQTEKSKVLIDCGLFQGHRDDYYKINSHFDFDPYQLDALVLSHAHIDHSGNIPSLVKQGFNKNIYATEATVDLCNMMLLDSAHIQQEDIKFVNKINKRKGLPLRNPLYTKEDAEKSLQFFKGKPYRKKFKITSDIDCTFYDAGHILGSSILFFNIRRKNKKDINLAYAVDLGREDIPILKDPEVLSKGKIDYLILESTYGGRLHGDINKAKDKLAYFVNKAAKQKGKVIIPSFALGRAQEVIYFLSELMKAKRIPALPIYVDSPLTVNITDVFRKHLECFDGEARLLVYHAESPFDIKNLHYVNRVQDSKRLNCNPRSMIIISASGMCEGGRILHHLKNNIEDERNVIIIVGYMAQNTLGKRLVEKREKVRIFGEEYSLKAEVGVINAFSAHADKDELIKYVKMSNHSIKKIFVVHGDEDQSEKLQESLKRYNFKSYLPKLKEEVILD
ncbi:MAG TPA: MBL fold metallo-hydrolase [Candidatus Omnitrophica bacterium]|nr:MBL fold metallo-hydrolase [Candidatus Omnitrophota bacterium]